MYHMYNTVIVLECSGWGRFVPFLTFLTHPDPKTSAHSSFHRKFSLEGGTLRIHPGHPSPGRATYTYKRIRTQEVSSGRLIEFASSGLWREHLHPSESDFASREEVFSTVEGKKSVFDYMHCNARTGCGRNSSTHPRRSSQQSTASKNCQSRAHVGVDFWLLVTTPDGRSSAIRQIHNTGRG